ncbi:MAG: 30S ribosomal protein S4e [Candidatus Nanoarchaeia archaeon]
MVKQHLKRLASPNTWPIPKKTLSFVKRPYPGAHKLHFQISISVFLRDMAKVVKSNKEAKYVLHKKLCFVDGKPVYDDKRPVGLFDVITFPSLKKQYRIIINKKNKLAAVEISQKEATMKISKVVKKLTIKGNKTQLTTLDSRSIIVDDAKKYNIGDSLHIEVPSQKIVDVLPFAVGGTILLQAGRHVGAIARIEEINGSDIVVKTNDDVFQTKRKYALVVGKDKPIITL